VVSTTILASYGRLGAQAPTREISTQVAAEPKPIFDGRPALPRLRTLLIALPLVLLSVVPAALGAAPENIGRVRIECVPPTDSAHQPIYDAAKKVRVL